MIKHFRDLEVYKKSQELYIKMVEFTKSFPPEARYLRDQSCRSSNAIHADIAEGFGRSVAEFKMYLTRALGSCNETISHINDALNVKFGNKELGFELLSEYETLGKRIYTLRKNWK